MRKISAHLILDGRGKCYSKGILTVDSDGTILGIQDTGGELLESAETEFFSGIIVPGFVNAHCHLELSSLQRTFQEGAGFIPFLKSIVENRVQSIEKIEKEAEIADVLMHKNGIVAVGDISNGSTTFEIKGRSRIFYFTFVEALGFAPERADRAFDWATICAESAEILGLKASIVPHAPYSISLPLFQRVAATALQTDSILSIHSQESREEDELYLAGTGGIVDHVRHNLGIDTSFFQPTGKSALQSTLPLLPTDNNLLLVHNLYTNQSDIEFITQNRKIEKTWFVLCPGSNLFIQNRFPDVNLFRKNQLNICLGTDSLASNHQLSVLEEMRIIQKQLPDISLDELTTWATFNGASALKIEDWAGSFEVGKRPGINLLTGMDIQNKKIVPGTRVKKIL
jgi:cytosine/adenosine deaminase-related metal-dependent hydrolase